MNMRPHGNARGRESYWKSISERRCEHSVAESVVIMRELPTLSQTMKSYLSHEQADDHLGVHLEVFKEGIFGSLLRIRSIIKPVNRECVYLLTENAVTSERGRCSPPVPQSRYGADHCNTHTHTHTLAAIFPLCHTLFFTAQRGLFLTHTHTC